MNSKLGRAPAMDFDHGWGEANEPVRGGTRGASIVPMTPERCHHRTVGLSNERTQNMIADAAQSVPCGRVSGPDCVKQGFEYVVLVEKRYLECRRKMTGNRSLAARRQTRNNDEAMTSDGALRQVCVKVGPSEARRL